MRRDSQAMAREGVSVVRTRVRFLNRESNFGSMRRPVQRSPSPKIKDDRPGGSRLPNLRRPQGQTLTSRKGLNRRIHAPLRGVLLNCSGAGSRVRFRVPGTNNTPVASNAVLVTAFSLVFRHFFIQQFIGSLRHSEFPVLLQLA